MKITAISDLHGDMPKLSGGDLLIVAGDLTARDREDEYYKFNSWLCDQEYDKKIVIAGNHDMLLQKDWFQYLEGCPAFDYLEDSFTEYKGLKIWGTPWSRWFEGVNPDCAAFMLKSEFELMNRFDLIPEDTDILVSHSPCYGRLDKALYGDLAGSTALRDRVDYLCTKALRYHFHGHIHEAYGVHEEGELKTFNVARMDRSYIPRNKIVNIEM